MQSLQQRQQIKQQVQSFLSQATTLLSSLEVGVLLESPATVLPDLQTPAQGEFRSLCWGSKVSEGFRNAVFWIESDLLIDADYLMACMAFETGERFESDIRNPASTATGLIQFMEFTAKRLGTTTQALAAMSEVDQLNYVWKYFSQWPKGRLKSMEDVYMAILYPKAIGQPLSYPMFIQGDSNYAVNSGLDKDKDHKVTKAEAAAKILEKFNRGMQPPNVWEGTQWHI